jgi:cytochrome c-type biogenesis protein CcmH
VKRWLPVLVLLAVLAVALGVGAAREARPSGTSARVTRIAKDVRCPTCEGLSANESDAPASVAIRDQIRAKVEAGYSNGQIRAYLVDRYGQDILLKPSATGVSALVWALPVAGLTAALAGLVLVFRRWRRARSQVAPADAEAGPSTRRSSTSCSTRWPTSTPSGRRATWPTTTTPPCAPTTPPAPRPPSPVSTKTFWRTTGFW